MHANKSRTEEGRRQMNTRTDGRGGGINIRENNHEVPFIHTKKKERIWKEEENGEGSLQSDAAGCSGLGG